MHSTAGTTRTDCDCYCRQNLRDSGTATPRPRLTPRQREIVIAWLIFDTKERAAQELYVTESTVKTHIQRIRERYAAVGRPATSKFALFIRAVQDGIIDVTDESLLGVASNGDTTVMPVRVSGERPASRPSRLGPPVGRERAASQVTTQYP